MLDWCVFSVQHSLVRTIPLSNVGMFGPDWVPIRSANESAEFFARCVLDAANSCQEVHGCLTERAVSNCEEVGCTGYARFEVACSGDVATIKHDCDGPHTRDCSRSGTRCDPTSPTGCSDRRPSDCPAGVSRADRCDGNVRLGCDGTDRVSYHDCSRLEGGSCQPVGDRGDCVQTTENLPPCGPTNEPYRCLPGGKLQACINNALFERDVGAPFCPP